MGMQTELYPYQREAFTRFMDRGSLLLAFDTGLGKTATAIAVAEDLLDRQKVRRVLLVVPANLKLQWARSLAKFTDLPVTDMKVKGETITIPSPDRCVIIDGAPAQREAQFRAAGEPEVDYVITGYDQVVSDQKAVRALGCDLVVLDEASAIKTPGTKRTGAVKRYLKAPYRLALTATPIENRPEEVYSIMQWVDDTVLGRYDLFDRAYIVRNPWGAVSSYRHLDVLHEKLSAAMVRKTRLDPEVAPYMPDVDSGVWRVDMDAPTRDAYKLMAADLLAAYDETGNLGGNFDVHAHYGAARDDNRDDKSALGRLMSVHGCMEMLLAHPVLVSLSAGLYETTDDRGSRYAHELVAARRMDWRWTSPKLDYLLRACDEILMSDPAAKILVFTWYRSLLEHMRTRFETAGHRVTLYHGGMSTREKEASVTRFGTDPATRLFLSSHAGAYGTDMPMANWLVNYDIPWGAGKATQINGRHVRASSQFGTVHVRDMVVTGTVEERKLSQKGFKNAVAARAVDGKGGAGPLESSTGSLREHALELLDPPGN